MSEPAPNTVPIVIPDEPVTADLAGLYRQARQQMVALLTSLDDGECARQVPACPGWRIRDVVAHVTAVAEDAMAGRLTGIPNDAFTADQVARMAGVPVPELVGRWATAGQAFEEVVAAYGIWPAVIDVASHEQDIRGALGAPGSRDSMVVRECTALLLRWFKPPVPVLVRTEDGTYPADCAHAGDTTLTVSCTGFEAFRWRMGRRSRAQLAALDWSGDPAPVLDHLTVFGPASADIVE
jgi:uncharacterized protein (TIGR03083 family)